MPTAQEAGPGGRDGVGGPAGARDTAALAWACACSSLCTDGFMYLYIMSLCGALVCILSFLELFPSYQTAVSAWDACRRPGGPPDNALTASLGALASTGTA